MVAKREATYMQKPVYLDCNATTPLDPMVAEIVMRYLAEDFGNAGSRTHAYGNDAKRAVETARRQVAALVAADADEVLFTSGATEANNLALLGLSEHARKVGKLHIISTAIEHKAVLEPLHALADRGFRVSLLPPNAEGWVDPQQLQNELTDETVLVSVMQVNNETGVRQPIAEIVEVLRNHSAYLHVDAAQGFGKDIATLSLGRIDMISASAHKIYGPKGIGALVVRKRGPERPPLTPLMFGGGQERGLRPGTHAVPLIAGFGLASELAAKNQAARRATCEHFRDELLAGLAPLQPAYNGDLTKTLFNTVNLSFGSIDSEALMLHLKELVAISNGSACTSSTYKPSHVLAAMGLPRNRIQSAVRLSWCHMTRPPDWTEVVARVRQLL
jgi:cysteine desulfurase